MKLQNQIQERLKAALQPQHLEVINESHMHSRGQETHFKVIIVANQFNGLRSVKRQQMVYAAVQDLFDKGLHALSQVTFTPEEWSKDGAQKKINASPTCAGAHKKP
jgi:BolA protein